MALNADVVETLLASIPLVVARCAECPRLCAILPRWGAWRVNRARLGGTRTGAGVRCDLIQARVFDRNIP